MSEMSKEQAVGLLLDVTDVWKDRYEKAAERLAFLEASRQRWSRRACSEIEKNVRLEDRVAQLEAALRPFAKAADNFDGYSISKASEWYAYSGRNGADESFVGAISVADLRQARAALGEEPST